MANQYDRQTLMSDALTEVGPLDDAEWDALSDIADTELRLRPDETTADTVAEAWWASRKQITIRGGKYGGRRIRVRKGDAELNVPGPPSTWVTAPLRHLAEEYPVGNGPWPWLRAHGISRPSPAGTTQPEAARKRPAVLLRLSPEASARLDALAVGSTRSAVVERMILAARVR